MTDWLKQHEHLLLALSVFSTLAFVLGLVLGPYLVVRIPEDYFVRDHRPTHIVATTPIWRWLLLVGKNMLGAVLLLAGIIMLALPGPGMLTILASLMLLNFPGKYRVERWIASRGPVFASLNWMRKQAGKAPLILPPSR